MFLPALRKSLAPSIATMLLAIGVCLTARAQEGEKRSGEQPDSAAADELYKEFAKLAPEHERFKEMVGKWKVDAKYYWDNPDEPMATQAKATFKLILGGRFLQQTFRDNIEGAPFEGIGISGYDKLKKKYVGVWIDNMGTGMMQMEGEMQEDGSTVEYGEAPSPAGKMKVKMVTTPVKDDKFLFTMYMILPDGSEQKGMELAYTRR